MSKRAATPAPPAGSADVRRFGLRFFLALLGVSVFAWAVALPNQLGPFQRFLARSASLIAGLAGSRSPVKGSIIEIQVVSIDINFECTGIYVLLILFTFLFAYPASWRARLAGMAIGAGGLTLINVLRIAFLIRVAELRPMLFDYFHEYVWQGIFLVLVIAYAMYWVERLQERAPA